MAELIMDEFGPAIVAADLGKTMAGTINVSYKRNKGAALEIVRWEKAWN